MLLKALWELLESGNNQPMFPKRLSKGNCETLTIITKDVLEYTVLYDRKYSCTSCSTLDIYIIIAIKTLRIFTKNCDILS